MADTNIITTKKCAKCKSVLPLTSFNKNKSKRDGLGTECRPCANAHSKNYHATHLEEHKARRAAYKAKNPERFKQWNKEQYARRDKEADRERKNKHRQENPEIWREYNRKYWKNNAEVCRERKRKYRKEFPALALVYVRNRQTRKRKAMPAWADLEAIKAIYRQCAFASRVTGTKYHVDHFYPLKSDLVCGLHNHYNLRIVPAAVNLSKGNSFPE